MAASFFISPDAEYKAKRIKQLLNGAGEKDVYARPNGQMLVGHVGHVWLLDLNELGELYKVDAADVIHPKPEPDVFQLDT